MLNFKEKVNVNFRREKRLTLLLSEKHYLGLSDVRL